MTIAVTHRGAIHDTNAGALVTLTSSPTWTPAANSLLITWISSSTEEVSPTSVTGHGVTYTKIGNLIQLGTGPNLGVLELWAAKAGASPTSVAVSATWVFARSGVSISEEEVTGHDNALSLAIGAGQMFPQVVSAGNSVATATSRTLTLAAAAHVNNRPISAFIHAANEVKTPQTSWTELDDGGYTSPNRSMETQYRSDAFDTTAGASWTTARASAGMAAEIAEAASGGGGTAYTQTKTDTIGGVDTTSRGKASIRTYADPLRWSDEHFQARGKFQIDALGLTDSQSKIHTKAIIDALALLDSRSQAKASIRSYIDALALLDPRTQVKVSPRSYTDLLGLVDSFPSIAGSSRSTGILGQDLIGEIVLGGEVLSTDYVVALTDLFGMLDSTTVQRVMVRTLVETEGLSDSIAKIVVKTLADSLAILDGMSRITSATRSIADLVGLLDANLKTAGKSLTDVAGLADAVTYTLAAIIARTIVDSLGLVDSQAAIKALIRAHTDNEALTDSATRVLAKVAIVADVFAIVDSLVNVRSTNVSNTDALGMTDVVSKNITKIMADVLGLIDSMSVARSKDLTDLVGLVDSRNLTRSKGLSDLIGLSDAVTRNVGFAQNLADLLGLTDSATRNANTVRSRIDQLGLTDSVTKGIVELLIVIADIVAEVPNNEKTILVPTWTQGN